jgi:hypothetical protein
MRYVVLLLVLAFAARIDYQPVAAFVNKPTPPPKAEPWTLNFVAMSR